MNPFQNIRKWHRKNFPDIDDKWVTRKIAEEETDRDLQKAVQQLLCDTHEEVLSKIPPNASKEDLILIQLQKLLNATKRTTSLQTVSAFQSSKLNAWVMWLTIIIVLQTSYLIYLTRCSLASPSSVPVLPATNNSADKK